MVRGSSRGSSSNRRSRSLAGIPGGANLPLYDALGASRIRHVLARHEQGAGFIAQGMARATGRAGRVLRHVGSGRDQSAHRDRRRQARLGPARRHHRPGAARDDRHRRVPGDRYLRPHHPDHQAQLSRPLRRRSCSRSFPTRSASRPPAARGRCVVDVPEGRAERGDRRRGAARSGKGRSAAANARRRHRARRGADRRSTPAAAPHRRRRHRRQRLRDAAPPGGGGVDSGRRHTARPRRHAVATIRSSSAWSACTRRATPTCCSRSAIC